MVGGDLLEFDFSTQQGFQLTLVVPVDGIEDDILILQARIEEVLDFTDDSCKHDDFPK